MKKYAKTIVAIAFLLVLGGAVKAEAQDTIVVKVPFQFVVGGKTLPAGTYTVHRLLNNSSGPFSLTSEENGTSVFVLPYVSDDAPVYNPQVTFQRVGGQSFLSTIQTPWEIYHIPVSQSAIGEALAKSRNGGVATERSGGN